MAMPNPPISPNSPANPIPSVLRKQVNWENLHFFQKSDVLYQLAATFCERFLPPFGDRTVDQMIQAARTGYRKGQDERLRALEEEDRALKQEIQRLKRKLDEKPQVL